MTGNLTITKAFDAFALSYFDKDGDGVLNEQEQAALQDIVKKSELPTADYLKLGQYDWDAISDLDFARRIDASIQRSLEMNEAFT